MKPRATQLGLIAAGAVIGVPLLAAVAVYATLFDDTSAAAAACGTTLAASYTPAGTTTGLPTGTQAAKLPGAAKQLLTTDQQTFASVYAGTTGLNAGVVSAWLLNEESGSAAQARQSAGNNDWLNIGYTDTETIGASDGVWASPVTAAVVSAEWTAGEPSVPGYGTASPRIQAILTYASVPTGEQIAAIQDSGWATGGEAALVALYEEITGSAPAGSSYLPGTSDTGSSTAVDVDCAQLETGALPTVTGPAAEILPNGEAAAPADGPAAVKELIAAGNQIIDKPYPNPDVHYGPLAEIWPAYDCSGATSYVLYKAGLFPGPNADVASQFITWGETGPGKDITIYANTAHVFIWVDGILLDTAHYGTTTPAGTGPRWLSGSELAAQLAGDIDDGNGGFVARHPAGY